MAEPPMKVVMVPLERYHELLVRSICAPKNLPSLSGKQKNKVADAMRDACIVYMHRQQMASSGIPDVQEFAEKTINDN